MPLSRDWPQPAGNGYPAGETVRGNFARGHSEREIMNRKWLFAVALFATSASTLMYEIVLTRLLSVVCWYYLAFVSVSMAMFGMTAGALAVQLRPNFFRPPELPRRLTQASFAMAISTPLALLTMLAIPIDVSLTAETLYSFCLFSAVISVPFFFSGVVVCLALTKTPFHVGRVYFVDLVGAAVGCVSSVALLKFIDASSAVFAISALLGLATAAYASFSWDAGSAKRSLLFAAAMALVTVANASTLHGIQPMWSKGRIDPRSYLLAEVWNPISKVRATLPKTMAPSMWGASPRTPAVEIPQIDLDIDNDAATAITYFRGDLSTLGFLRYDVTSLPAQLRHGGTAAIIGVGGGRDVLNCAENKFRRIVGIEVNSAVVNLVGHRLEYFSGFSKIPGFELHTDEGRSFLTRSPEKFDLIQASMVDTWAATSAGAMSLTENGLYTVEGWRIFYDHLKPNGLLAFSRWNREAREIQTDRLFAVAWAMLLSEGVQNPADHIAVVSAPKVATLMVSPSPLSADDLQRIRSISEELDFRILFLPGAETPVPELRTVAAAHNLGDLSHLFNAARLDYSAVFDASPYFFNVVRITHLPRLGAPGAPVGSLLPLIYVFCFMLAAAILLGVTVLLPVWRGSRASGITGRPSLGAFVYFAAIGLGFMLVELGMMQQLSIFLGEPVYSLAVVLAGLILATGIGSLVSDRIEMKSSNISRMPAFLAAVIILIYSRSVLELIHHFEAGLLWQRVLLSLALISPCGFLMGFCFPAGLRRMSALECESSLPWMWALNGAAATLGSFVAVVVSMNSTITTCIVAGAACYFLAAVALPVTRKASVAVRAPQEVAVGEPS